MSVWSNLRTKDKIKLIYAYIVSPIWICGDIGGGIIIELYQKNNKILRDPTMLREVSALANSIAWKLGILTYLPLILPATVIRFIIPRREIKYGIEMYCYMLLSMFLTRVLYVVMMGELIPTLGFLDSLVMYCVLSYKTTEYQEFPRSYRYVLTFLTLGIVFVVLYFTSEHFTNTKRYIFPIWEAIALCVVLNTYKTNSITKESEQPHEATYQAPRQEPSNEASDMAARLVNIALAHIGRPTASPNQYLTSELTEARHQVERPFLKLLAERFKDTETRKALSRHFMLYKEVTLFIIFAMLLSKDKALHAKVRTKLKERLFRRAISGSHQEA